MLLFELILLGLQSSSGCVEAEDGVVVRKKLQETNTCRELVLLNTPGCFGAEIQICKLPGVPPVLFLSLLGP